jgi:hypothetical protein
MSFFPFGAKRFAARTIDRRVTLAVRDASAATVAKLSLELAHQTARPYFSRTHGSK